MLVMTLLLIVLLLLAAGVFAVRTTQPRAMQVSNRLHSSIGVVETPAPPPAVESSSPYAFVSDADVL